VVVGNPPQQKKERKLMYENNNEPTVTVEVETMDSLKDKVAILEAKLSASQEHKERIALNWDRRTRELDDLRDYLAKLIRDGDLDDRDIIDTLVSQHGVQAMRKVAVTFEVTTSAVIEVAYGEDIDLYSFDLDGISYDGSSLDLGDESFKIIDEEDVI
jgi:hypothetical protein